MREREAGHRASIIAKLLGARQVGAGYNVDIMIEVARARAVVAAVICLAVGLALAGCGPLDDKSQAVAPPAPPNGPIVATERGANGGRLVFIAESGERLAELTRTAAVAVRDNSPSWSPDGRFVVFASSRGRASLLETSLWIIPAKPEATPRRLTYGDGVDRDPVWSRDGRGVIFASNRGGSFDLWRVEVAINRYGHPAATGKPVQLTSAPGQELHPSIAPDGERIAYMGVDRENGSRLWLWRDGQSQPISAGPADLTPRWSPDGTAIAFAAPTPRDQEDIPARCPTADSDADLYLITATGENRRLVAREPLSDQTGPVWSRDGRFLFATSVYRSVDSCQSLLSSITFVDLEETPRQTRALHDPAAVESRTGPALDPVAQDGALDVARLRRNEPYKEALRQAVVQELLRAEERLRRQAPRQDSQ